MHGPDESSENVQIGMRDIKTPNLLLAGQDSLISCRNSQGSEIRATPVRLTRHTALFEVYNPFSILQLSEVLADYRINLGDRCVYSGRAVVSNLVNTGIMVLCEVTLDEGWLDVDIFSPIAHPSQLRDEFEAFMAHWRKTQAILPQFKLAVADFGTLLTDLRRWLEQVELGVRSEPTGVRADLERQVLTELEKGILPEVFGWMDQFDTAADAIEEDARPAHRAYARRLIHPLVMCAPFVYRTYQKPLGYAGDYEMVNMILRDPHEGSSMFAKLINVVFLQNPPAEAHRNRIKYLHEHLKVETARVSSLGRRARVLSMGCGPAREVQLFLGEDELSNRADFALLDFNPDTIAYTRQILSSIQQQHHRQSEVTLYEKSINQLLKEHGRASLGKDRASYDFVFCAGLFDYVSDRVCRRLMDLFYELLAPGGLLIATNVHAAKSFRHSMDYLLEWHLIYRNHEQMLQLTPTRANREHAIVLSDPTGVNLFLEIRKPDTQSPA